MAKLNFFFILVCSVIFLSNESFSEDVELSNSTFGIFANYGLNMHTADFNMLRDIPNCCPDFETGNGTDLGLGLLYEYRLESKFSIGLRLGLTNLSGQLSSIENTTVMIDNAPGDGEFEHLMDGKFTAIGLTPMLIYNATDQLKVHLGFQYNFISTSTFDQVEKIKTPANIGTFIDENGEDTHSRTRNEYAGDIPDAKSSSMAVTLGVGYELPLNKKNTLRLTPEIFYNYGLSELVSETSWKVSRIEGGIALKYTPEKSEDKKERVKEIYKVDSVGIGAGQFISRVVPGKEIITTKTEETDKEIITYQYINRMDTVVYQKENPNAYKDEIASKNETDLNSDNQNKEKDKSLYTIDVKVDLKGIENDGTTTDTPVFKVEEFVSHKINPLLKYVFFEENSSKLDDKYVKLSQPEIRIFATDSLFKADVMDMYYNVLNILAYRMKINPKAKITLTGCNSDFGPEENNMTLSRERAESVKDYLTSVWNIDPNRIIIKTRNLPIAASLPKDEKDKAEENRRVEISSNNPEIVKYLTLNSIERKVNPPKALLSLNIDAEADIKSWKITATQRNSDRVFTKEGNGIPPKEIIWNFSNTPTSIPKNPEELIVKLEVTDIYGNTATDEMISQPITIRTIDQKENEGVEDYKIDKYRLILFDFNQSNITGENREIVNHIKKNIETKSEVTISGHTDRTGDNDYNKTLSQRRAESVKSALSHSKAEAKGVGEEDLLYDNDSPEARFYCRTVVVEVKTKK